MIPKFGVAGVPINYKGKPKDFYDWLRDMNLNAYEVQCTFGFKMSDKNKELILKAQNDGFYISIHGPYYINLGSVNPTVVARSIDILKQGVELARSINCTRIIFHPGGGHENTEQGRKDAISRIINHLNTIANEVDMGDVKFYPEIGGKTANLGSLDEIIAICKGCEFAYPCIDIAHLHAREIGSITSKDVLMAKLEHLKQELPNKFNEVHFHAYTINYGDKGEIKHLVHGENMPNGNEGLPNLDWFVELLHEFNLTPWVISEAHDSQELGAKYMRDKYVELKEIYGKD
ncbi:MAG: TIM barrel protein [Clostridia bacterium]|nr:TIM barrel protein [Clostridia bacterium]